MDSSPSLASVAPQLTYQEQSSPPTPTFSPPPWPLTEIDYDLQELSKMETAVRWAPASTAEDQRFLYVDSKGQTFSHCRVTSRPDKSTLSYEVLSSASNGSEFRSFDWSPIEEKLVAVGHAMGEVVVVHLEDGTRTPLTLPSKVQRVCHGLAWNTRGLLAAELDKFRGDHCVYIWDPNQRPVRGTSRGGSDRQVPDPLRKYANGEPVTSLTFLRDQPNVLIAGTKGQSNYFASCAPHDDATVCIWDRRSGSRYSAATGGSSGTIDGGQVLEIKPDIDTGSTIWNLRFSQTHRGRLGMSTDTGIFRAYHVEKEYSAEEHRVTLEKTVGGESGKNYPELLYTKNVREFQTGSPPQARSEDPSKRVGAFDFLNFCSSGDLEAITILNDKTVAMYRLPPIPGPVSLSFQSLFVRGGFANGQDFKTIAPETGVKVGQALDDAQGRAFEMKLEAEMEEKEVEDEEDLTEIWNLSSRARRELFVLPEKAANFKDALTMMAVPRLRLQEGHLLDPRRIFNIVTEDPGLLSLWDWISFARTRAASKSQIVRGVDMNYLGVQSVWTGNLGLSLENRLASSDLDDDVDVSKLIEELVKQLELPDYKMCDTDFKTRRQLCLDICGGIGTVKQLEKEMAAFIKADEITKAALFAMFQEEDDLAYKALKDSPAEMHKFLAMAVAGGSTAKENKDWDEACAELAIRSIDPFTKAILARVRKGSWDVVLEETTSLPLKYRVQVALRWLPDDKLTTYIRDATSEAVRQGDIEGWVLTGLDHAAMDLFDSYIDKFNDFQTAVSVMSYAVPRFISDPRNISRFYGWRNAYRYQMNRWKMYLWRARFDINSRDLAVTWDGRRLTKPPPQQVSLVCTYCTQLLSQKGEQPEHEVSGAETIHHTQGNPLGSSQTGGIICPKCGRHMPRCGVCGGWLGTPRPMPKSSVAEDATKGIAALRLEEGLRKSVAFCIRCSHGNHADHAKTWFETHRKCPVTDCNCMCRE
ncbi:predicted protein [Uncinocarpus reesii 1704]|uniref:Uncharacterized protein n=1 Tax=Uncinocarpus reesii (strain UAMH 1704) TaxID=336963 RepID=C4JK45_UNCRE|nr:uncharacterized protein UREG_02002 [Uncinocarpus reesii 1704]EEP77153.1 predicted protein [Uncinocarpus reesii 1704]